MKIENIEQIRSLALQGENNTVEFKKSTGQLERGMETLCAFLNRDGGTVLFGISDKGEIIGQEVSDSTRQDIAEALSRFQPSITPQISYINIPATPNKYIIAIKTSESRSHRPYYYKRTPYWRIESTTSPMPADILEDMLMLKGGKQYIRESLAAENVTLEDIDQNLVLGAVRLGIYHNRLPERVAMLPLEDILKGFHLYTPNGELTNAAMALFGRDVWPNYPQMLLRMAKFNGLKNTDDFIDNRQVKGNIFVLLDAAMSFFVKHLNISGGIDPVSWQRDDELEIPRKALRESIINACAHRLYHHRGSSISIAIFDDRIEVCNTGTYPLGITQDNILRKDESEPMNPIIANVLYKTSYLEQWGRGIRMMHESCISKGLKAPSFTTNGHSVKTTFFFETTKKTDAKKEEAPIGNEKHIKDDYARNKTTSRREGIIQLMRQKPLITTSDLGELLRVSKRTIIRDIEILTNLGKIKREGSTYNGKWVVYD